MAEFAAVSLDLLDDEEFLSLSNPDFMHVWLTIIVWRKGGKCGIFKLAGTSLLVFHTRRPPEVISAALAEFEALGWIERDGDYIWIRSRIKHRRHNQNWFVGALKEAESFREKTALGQRCIDYYRPDDSTRFETIVESFERLGDDSLSTAQHSTNKAQHKSGPADWAAKLAELEGNLPQSHSIPLLWEALKDARRAENKTGKVSDSVFASLLTEILALELSPEQLAHGMARGVPNKTYIAKVGRKFVPSPPKPGQITEAFNPYANIVCKD